MELIVLLTCNIGNWRFSDVRLCCT